MGEFMFRLDARKARRNAFLAALGVLVCVGGLAFSTEFTPAWAVWAGWAMIAAFSAYGVMQTLRVLDRRPAIVVNSWGVTDRRMRVAAPWESVSGVKLWGGAPLLTSRWLALDVRDPPAVNATLLGQARIWSRLSGVPSVLLDLEGLEASPQAVLSAIRQFLALSP